MHKYVEYCPVQYACGVFSLWLAIFSVYYSCHVYLKVVALALKQTHEMTQIKQHAKSSVYNEIIDYLHISFYLLSMLKNNKWIYEERIKTAAFKLISHDG